MDQSPLLTPVARGSGSVSHKFATSPQRSAAAEFSWPLRRGAVEQVGKESGQCSVRGRIGQSHEVATVASYSCPRLEDAFLQAPAGEQALREHSEARSCHFVGIIAVFWAPEVVQPSLGCSIHRLPGKWLPADRSLIKIHRNRLSGVMHCWHVVSRTACGSVAPAVSLSPRRACESFHAAKLSSADYVVLMAI